jgi:hypothetical protein
VAGDQNRKITDSTYLQGAQPPNQELIFSYENLLKWFKGIIFILIFRRNIY